MTLRVPDNISKNNFEIQPLSLNCLREVLTTRSVEFSWGNSTYSSFIKVNSGHQCQSLVHPRGLSAAFYMFDSFLLCKTLVLLVSRTTHFSVIASSQSLFLVPPHLPDL